MVHIEDVRDKELRAWLLRTAEQYGAGVLHVAGDGNRAPFAFSVGAWRRFGAPEVVVIGLARDVAHEVVNTYVRRVGAGEHFKPGELYEGFVAESAVTFEKVAKGYYAEFFGSAMLVYPDANFPAVQLVLPTPEGKFSWYPDAPAGFADFQPLLSDSGRPESWTPGVDGP